LVTRARLVLLAADGLPSSAIARRIGLSQQSVCLWRRRYLEQGIQGLHDELKPGRPRSISDEVVASLVRKTLQTKPKDGTHWTIRTIAREARLSPPTVHRIWQAFGLQPHRQKHFKLSTDPFFVEKVRDRASTSHGECGGAVSTRRADPPRTYPTDASMELGYVEGVTDYERHGTTALFAALT
jgi:putative transposase